MVLFPNAKINLGLRVLKKRSDGYHSIETIFLPIDLYDSLEFIESYDSESFLEITGAELYGDSKDNLVMKAWQIMHDNYNIPCVRIHLHKVIPAGAGLGGGSSDAAFMLKGLNEFFGCKCSEKQLEHYASLIGSDCAFFIRNTASVGTGRGEILEQLEIPLHNHEILLVNPGIHISTRDAYSGVFPKNQTISLKQLIEIPDEMWQKEIRNDFESYVFKRFPLIGDLKDKFIKMGAVYASMSGSGSTVYGIFREGELDSVPYNFREFYCIRSKLILQ